MGLGVVFNEFQIMSAAYFAYPFGIGASAIEMDNHYRPCAGRYRLLYHRIIYLESEWRGFYQHWFEIILRYRKDGRNVGIGRHNHLIALRHDAHLDICTEDKRQGIKAVAAANAVSGSDIPGIMLLEIRRGFTLKIPSPLYDTPYGLLYLLAMQGGNLLQFQISYHISNLYFSDIPHPIFSLNSHKP